MQTSSDIAHLGERYQTQRIQFTNYQRMRFLQIFTENDEQFFRRLWLIDPFRFEQAIWQTVAGHHDLITEVRDHKYFRNVVTQCAQMDRTFDHIFTDILNGNDFYVGDDYEFSRQNQNVKSTYKCETVNRSANA